MQTKPLLYGLVGFFIGGFIVAVAATTFNKSEVATNQTNELSMSQMEASLQNKTGDAYDEAFLSGMIAHHQSALEMAKLSDSSAKHPEIKQLSKEIVTAQQKEITQMKQWQKDWGYKSSAARHGGQMMH